MNFKPFSEQLWKMYPGASIFPSGKSPMVVQSILINWDNETLEEAKLTNLCGYGADVVLDAEGLFIEIWNARTENCYSASISYADENFPEVLAHFVGASEETETSMTWMSKMMDANF